MDTHYTAEQETFRSTMRRFLEDRGGTDFARSRWNEPVPATAENWQSLADLGVRRG